LHGDYYLNLIFHDMFSVRII